MTSDDGPPDPAPIAVYSLCHYAKNFENADAGPPRRGDKDYRVPVTQGINLFGVLQAK